MELAGSYRISWSAVVACAQRQGLLDRDTGRQLRTDAPVRGDFLAILGDEPEPDLPAGHIGPAWRRATLHAWHAGLITASRTVELLHGEITTDDLPSRSVESAGL